MSRVADPPPRHRSGRFRRTATPLALGAALALAVAACGRSGSNDQPSGPTTSGASSSGSTSAAPSTSAAGDFGTLKSVCGPGTAKGGSGRGLTADTITIGVMGDPGAAAAPGLEQEFFDMADGFAKWCNAAGGINGRKIAIDKHDAKLFNVGQVMTQACQKDFMIVGGGNAFDSAGVKIRENCKLGSIPAYAVSPENVASKFQVQAAPVPPNYFNNGVARLLAEAFPETKTKGVGVAGSNLASLIPTGKKIEETLKDYNLKVPVYQAQPPLVTNYRPYMEEMKGAGVVGLQVVTGQDLNPIVQAEKNIGWTPSWQLFSIQFYGPQAEQAAKALGTFPPTYVQFNALPFDLKDKYPVLQQTESIVKSAVSNPKLTGFTLSAINAWMLWATSAKACGDTLTQDCVLQKAQEHTDWDAGGLYPKLNIKAQTATPCIIAVKLTNTGFQYDEKVTNPTDGAFNCNPENLKKVQTYVSSVTGT
jgi:ABC-type branched-subunit amino acid transport system substrate-binding protein